MILTGSPTCRSFTWPTGAGLISKVDKGIIKSHASTDFLQLFGDHSIWFSWLIKGG